MLTVFGLAIFIGGSNSPLGRSQLLSRLTSSSLLHVWYDSCETRTKKEEKYLPNLFEVRNAIVSVLRQQPAWLYFWPHICDDRQPLGWSPLALHHHRAPREEHQSHPRQTHAALQNKWRIWLPGPGLWGRQWNFFLLIQVGFIKISPRRKRT